MHHSLNLSLFSIYLLLQVSKTSSGDIKVKLADFGLAMEVLEPIFTVCGTPTYVAPEILAETGRQNPVSGGGGRGHLGR